MLFSNIFKILQLRILFRELFLGKVIFAFVLFTIISTSSSAQVADTTANPNGNNKFYYENGQLASEGLLKMGKPEGYWKNYFENGKLKSAGNRFNTRLDGLWKFYNEKGFLTAEINYDGGKKNGVTREYYDSLVIHLEEIYKNDKLNGKCKYYNEQGKLERIIPFVDGVENGIAREFDETGELFVIYTYKMGYLTKQITINRNNNAGLKQGPWKQFYDDSDQIKWEGNYKTGLKHGTFREYSPAGKVTKQEEYIDGKIADFATEVNGKRVKMEVRREYYPNAQDKTVGTYKNGVRDGIFREYAIDGTLTGSKVYKMGRLNRVGLMDEAGLEQGFWQNLYPNGAVSAEGNYIDGKKTGYWKFYHENGNMMEEGNYVMDKADGPWRWYYETGKLMREEIYIDGKEAGVAQEYNDSTAKIVAKGNYLNGKKEGNWVYEIGTAKAIGKYMEGKEEGVWREYYKNGQISFDGEYIHGIENGSHTYYYENGVVKESRSYRLGLKEGTWKIFDIDGSLIVTIVYKNNVEVKIEGKKIVPKTLKRGRALSH
jgi:antitoxin component YwqK of YwqJK toxin-antitoxin module